jgi:hypothetical protein
MGMKTLLLCLLTAIFLPKSCAQESNDPSARDSLLIRDSYKLWFDGGFYPFRALHSGGFQPSFNLRLGVGRSFSTADMYAFLEFTRRNFDPPDELFSTTSSHNGYDIAAYAAGTIFRTIFLGAGAYFTHQDNVVTRDWLSNATHESGIRSHLGLYYLVGLQYQIQISQQVSVPIGIYYRDQEAPSGVFIDYQISFRVGAIYLHR